MTSFEERLAVGPVLLADGTTGTDYHDMGIAREHIAAIKSRPGS